MSWIPEFNSNNLIRFALYTNIDTIYLTKQIDKYNRNLLFFKVLNPDSLNVIYTDIKARNLNVENVKLSFFKNDNNEIILRILNRNNYNLEPNKRYCLSCYFKFFILSEKVKGYTTFIDICKKINY